MDIQSIIEEYHKAVDIFSRGNPEPVKNLYSQSENSMLATHSDQQSRDGTECLRHLTLRHLDSETEK